MKTNATVEVTKVTPEQATDWLAERWGEQRTVRTGHVLTLASDMTAGKFKLTPDAILRIKGKLANGQHRLAAVVLSGKPQYFLVMTSNDEELYKVIDAGLHRTVSDGLMGVSYSKAIPAVARWVQAYESGSLSPGGRSGGEAGGDQKPSQCELIDYCISNQQVLSEAAAFVAPLYDRTKLLRPSIGASIYVISATRGHLEKVKEFLTQVYISGGNTAANDLRNRLIVEQRSKSKLTAGYIFGITIKAFKSFLNGTRPGVLKWAKDEGFPNIETT